MPSFSRTVNKPFGVPKYEHNKYKHHNAVPEYLTPQIIPRRPVSSLLNQMAYRTSQKYDRSSKPTTSINESTPMIIDMMNKPEHNSDVLFFPGQNSIACAGKVANSGKINI